LKTDHIFTFIKKATKAGSIAILSAIVALSSCKPNKPEEIKELTNREELPSMTIENLTSTITDSGRVKYRFMTPEMKQFDKREKPATEFNKGLHLIVYNKKETIDAQIKCKQAIYHQSEDLWELSNDVEAVNSAGDVINTELLFWNTKKKIIYSDKFIKITTQTEIITGYGFESDEKMENYKIKNINGILSIDKTK
jgi:LPS export ABC transporter protein LptC